MTSFINSLTVTDAIITASNLSETDDHPAYNPATTYALGGETPSDTTHVSDPATKQIYKSVQAGNTGNALNDENWWVVQNYVNKFRAFDRFIADQANFTDEVTFTLTPGDIVDSIAFFNLAASSVQVVVTSAADGEVYNETHNMANLAIYIDAYEYFFGPEDRQTKLLIEKFPPYSDATIDITITNTGTQAKVGQIDVGRSVFIGQALTGTTPFMDDFSGKERDTFGRFRLIERDYAEGVIYRIATSLNDVDRIRTLIASRRGIPTTFYVSDDTVKMGTLTYGIPKPVRPALQFGATIFTMEVEGFT